MSAAERFIVAGGGIGGLAAARALSLVGRPSLVVERAAEFAEIGAGIQIGPNGFRMLEALGLREAVSDVAAFPDDILMMDGVSEEEVTRISLGDAFRARFGYPYALVHRADLHRILLDVCLDDPRIELRPGISLESFTDSGEGVEAITHGGEMIGGAAMIGADGLWSTVRAAIVGDGPPRVSGHIAYRAVLPIEQIEERFRQNKMILWGGPHNHLVQYPLRGGRLFNLVAVFHSDRYVEGWDRQGDPEELRNYPPPCGWARSLIQRGHGSSRS